MANRVIARHPRGNGHLAAGHQVGPLARDGHLVDELGGAVETGARGRQHRLEVVERCRIARVVGQVGGGGEAAGRHRAGERGHQAALELPHGELAVVPGATHLFEEPGTLDEVARHYPGLLERQEQLPPMGGWLTDGSRERGAVSWWVVEHANLDR